VNSRHGEDIEMNHNSYNLADDRRPILIVPYMWIGDFVRCHSVVRLLRQRFPDRPVDMLATKLCAPLADYMPGVRQAIVADLPRGRLALGEQRALALRLKHEAYGAALIMRASPSGPDLSGRHASSSSTTCATASGACRA
jgi:heptosyltransferase-2